MNTGVQINLQIFLKSMGNGNVKSLQKSPTYQIMMRLEKVRKECMSPLHRKSRFWKQTVKFNFQ